MNHPHHQQWPNNFRPPQPSPPVSPPGQPQAPPGETGVIYGTQQEAIWKPGALDERQVLDLLKCNALWRVSVFGRAVLLRINYGTLATRQIANLRTPLVMHFPGQVTITAQPIDDLGTSCTVTATQATGGARSVARQMVATVAPTDLDLNPDGVDFFAITACSLSIAGTVVAVPAFTIAPLVAGSQLLDGSGFVEYEA